MLTQTPLPLHLLFKECHAVLKKLFLYLLLICPAAFAQPILTVYTYNSFTSEWGPGKAIKKAFEDTCDCQLKFVALNDSVSLLNRLLLEGKKSRADIVLGLDNNLLASASKSGLFAKHNINTTALSLPVTWDSPYFIPYDYSYFAFVYNSEKLTTPPKSLHELVESQQPWKIIYQDPRTSTPGLGLLLWMQKVYGDQAPAAWQKLAKKTVTVTRGWSEAYSLFLKGEADMVLSYTTSVAYHLVEEKQQRYRAAHFSDGHYLQVEIAGQLASSKQPELAKAFMQFMLSERFQKIIAAKNWMYPVIKSALPDVYKTLPVPDITLQFTAQEVAEQRNRWIRAWQNALSQ